MTTSADTGFDFQKRRSDSRHERSSLADRRPAENEDAMTLLILGVKVGAHHFLQTGQYRAALPQQQSRSVVACRRRRRGRPALVEVLPRGRSQVRRGREIDDRFGTLGRRYRKKLGEPEQVRNRAPLSSPKRVATKPGCRQFAVTRCAAQPAGELARKQDVAQFRATIGFQGPVILRRLKIVEIQGGVLVRGGSRVNDARGSRG